MHAGIEGKMWEVENRLRRVEWESRLFGKNHLSLLIRSESED